MQVCGTGHAQHQCKLLSACTAGAVLARHVLVFSLKKETKIKSKLMVANMGPNCLLLCTLHRYFLRNTAWAFNFWP